MRRKSGAKKAVSTLLARPTRSRSRSKRRWGCDEHRRGQDPAGSRRGGRRPSGHAGAGRADSRQADAGIPPGQAPGPGDLRPIPAGPDRGTDRAERRRGGTGSAHRDDPGSADGAVLADDRRGHRLRAEQAPGARETSGTTDLPASLAFAVVPRSREVARATRRLRSRGSHRATGRPA
jgi:hypothetical protein